jgi:hypothetical protein
VLSPDVLVEDLFPQPCDEGDEGDEEDEHGPQALEQGQGHVENVENAENAENVEGEVEDEGLGRTAKRFRTDAPGTHSTGTAGASGASGHPDGTTGEYDAVVGDAMPPGAGAAVPGDGGGMGRRPAQLAGS